MFRVVLTLLVVVTLAACAREDESVAPEAEAPAAETASAPATPAAETPAERLNALVEEYFERFLEMNPLFATFIDDHRYDDRLANNISPEALEAADALEREYLEKVEAIDESQLTGQDRLTYDIFVRDRRTNLEGSQFPAELLPVNQFFSLPNFFAQLGSGTSVQPFETYEDYEKFLGRAEGFAVWIDQAIANMRIGMERGIVQPRIVIERTIPQLEAQIVQNWEESLFYRPIATFPEGITDEQRATLREKYQQAITGTIGPAYQRLRDFLRDEYLPSTRDTVGMHALEGGSAWYAYLVRTTTTTELTPDQIHQIGLDEVARIKREMEGVMREVGFEGTLQEFFEHLRTDDRFYYDEPEQLLDAYRALKEKVDQAAPRLFSLLPKADFEVRPVEEFRAKSQAAASYMPASQDGSRPGIFYVNTYDLKARPSYNVEAIFLHEAAPGHHFQISIQQELPDLPRFRRFGGYTAYDEGWGLYAETLGKELGLYQDPYQYYGKLAAEMLRSIRLVTDTGMHHKGWTREQALQFMRENSSMPETDAVAEIERYIAIPSQALAYKVGQLKISELRAKSEAAFGDAFDVREFHARVLEDGALPLDVLEAKIDRWIAAEAPSQASSR
jgi:uncharacterized protein (DUF885 family)